MPKPTPNPPESPTENPAISKPATTHTPSTIFAITADIRTEDLLAHACESLASASVMASDGGLTADLISRMSPIPCRSEPARDGRQR
ncbi:hypothetical protein DKY63_30195 [Pseudomonas putida]|uniref:Uncharacterized protein n=1 Tax=Pseudomonas putida TaxID=303 RepID=A0A2Z4RSK7_PSEPU|nr:hypothetical protein [Pseudomonas putida]AWY43952.1 hypothetical protein DKY63_30195 [Pseudomonas putida]